VNGKQRARWEAPGCTLEMRWEGALHFDEDFTDLVGLARGGRLEVEERGPAGERRLVLEDGGGEGPSMAYRVEAAGAGAVARVEGGLEELDAAGRTWARSVWQELFRRTGYRARERAQALLRRGGMPALMAELERTEGPHAQQLYVSALLEGGVEPPVAARLLQVARRWDSDHAKEALLRSLARRGGTGDARVREEAWAVAGSLESDHYRHAALAALLGRERPASGGEVDAALALVGRMESDHYRGAVLERLAREEALGGERVQAFLAQVRRLESDHYRAGALTALLKGGGGREPLAGEAQAEVLRAVPHLESDHYRAEVLLSVARKGGLEGPAREAYRRVAEGLESEHYRQEVLSALRR
jgi:hypothetical protein